MVGGWPAGKHAPEIGGPDISLIICMIREKQHKELSGPPFQKIQLRTTDSIISINRSKSLPQNGRFHDATLFAE